MDFDIFNRTGFCVRRERDGRGDEIKTQKDFALHFLRIVGICWITSGTAAVNLQRSVTPSVSKFRIPKKQQKSIV